MGLFFMLGSVGPLSAHCCDNLKYPKEVDAIKTRLENIHDYPDVELVVQRVW